MFQKMKKGMKNEKGLTLIELLAVIVILAIIAAIAIPAIGNIIDNSRVKGAKADAANVLNAANLYFTENSNATTFTNETDGAEDFVSEMGTISEFTVTKDGMEITATGTAGGKGYSITQSTLTELQVDKGDTENDTFVWNE